MITILVTICHYSAHRGRWTLSHIPAVFCSGRPRLRLIVNWDVAIQLSESVETVYPFTYTRTRTRQLSRIIYPSALHLLLLFSMSCRT